jgi:hypothetical protein
MIVRADHVAGGAFVALGVLVIAMSGDLPFGTLALPGSGFMPKVLAGFSICFGLVLIARAGKSRRLAEISWSDGRHAAPVVLLTAVSISLFERLGFVLSMILLILSLLILVERHDAIRSAAFSAIAVMITYVTFEYVLKTPLVTGPFGF